MLVWSGKEVRCHYSKSALNLHDDVNSEREGGCAVKTWSEGYIDFMCRIYTPKQSSLEQNEDPWL